MQTGNPIYFWNPLTDLRDWQLMSRDEKKRHMVYGITDSYFQAVPLLARSAALGGNLRQPILRGREKYHPYTVDEARSIVNRIRRMETQQRLLAKEKLALLMALDEIVCMPGEDQAVNCSLQGNYLSTERLPTGRSSSEPGTTKGSAMPEDQYDNLSMVHKQALRFIAAFMNRITHALDTLEAMIDSKAQSTDSDSTTNSEGLSSVPNVWFRQRLEELNNNFFSVRGEWLNMTKQGTCFIKRPSDYC